MTAGHEPAATVSPEQRHALRKAGGKAKDVCDDPRARIPGRPGFSTNQRRVSTP
jgi:hypothetical protein